MCFVEAAAAGYDEDGWRLQQPDDEFGMMDVDDVLTGWVSRRNEYLEERRMKASQRIGNFLYSKQKRFKSPILGSRFSNAGRYAESRFTSVQNLADERFAASDQYTGTSEVPPPVSVPDSFVSPEPVDDFTRLKNNERTGKYVASFNPFGKKPVVKPYKFDEL